MAREDPAPVAQGEFAIKDCALIAIATGRRAASIRELREVLAGIDPGSIYYHFWGGLIQPRFEEREYNNDFAGFVRHGLHDPVLAERMAMVDPTGSAGLEDLRQELLDLIDERLDEAGYLPWVRSVQPFEFIRSQIVVFDTRRRLGHPRELAEVVPGLSVNCVFYHFIDARRRLAGRGDDFRAWLDGYGEAYGDLSARLAEVDPYFVSLSDLRAQLGALFRDYFAGAAP